MTWTAIRGAWLTCALVVVLASAAHAEISYFDLGTGAPPTTVGGVAMTPFPLDGSSALSATVSSVPSPFGGAVMFSPSLTHFRIGEGWATWSHGYTRDVYATGSEVTSVTLTLPPNTAAFYFYAEPNPFELFTITAIASDGTVMSTGFQPVDGKGGARGFAFVASGTSIHTIVVSSTIDFAVGEFGIAEPVANDDSYATNEDTKLEVLTGGAGVLGNDGGDLTAELVAPPDHGTVTLNADGTFTYTPDPDFNGVDSFLYVGTRFVGDVSVETNIATVTITVRAVNDPPFFDVIADDFVNAPLNGTRTVDITGVVPGPVNESEQIVQLDAVSSNPALVSNITISGTGPTRTLSYQRVSGSGGTATITVTATDNGGTADGGDNTFVRTFDVTMDGAAAIQGTVTQLIPNPDPTKPPKLAVVITADPIDFNGNGVIDCPGDAYFIFPPRPAPGQPFNVIPSGAETVPEAPPWRIGVAPDGDLVEVCATPLSFPAVIDLSEWKTSATGTTLLDYVSIVRDPELLPDGSCPSGSSCIGRIWTGVKPLGAITFTAGDTVAVSNTVTLKTLDRVARKTRSTPLANVQIRTFDIRNRELRAVARDAIRDVPRGGPLILFAQLSKVLGAVFEADKGRLGTCVTDDSGRCLATQPAPAFDLVIAKFVDPDTGKTVYTAVTTPPRNFVDGIAEAHHVILKLATRGVFQGYGAALLQLVR